MNRFLLRDILKFPTRIQEIAEAVVAELDNNSELMKCIIKTLTREQGRFILRVSDNTYTTPSPVVNRSTVIRRPSPPISQDDVVISFECMDGKELNGCGWYPDINGFTTPDAVGTNLSDTITATQLADLIANKDDTLDIKRSMFYALSKKTAPNITISFPDDGKTIIISEKISSSDKGDYILSQCYAKT